MGASVVQGLGALLAVRPFLGPALGLIHLIARERRAAPCALRQRRCAV